MIVRISGEGQFRLDDSALSRINVLDDALEAALDSETFPAALEQLLAEVRALGEPLDPAELLESDVILPPADANPDEVRGLFGADGLIPG